MQCRGDWNLSNFPEPRKLSNIDIIISLSRQVGLWGRESDWEAVQVPLQIHEVCALLHSWALSITMCHLPHHGCGSPKDSADEPVPLQPSSLPTLYKWKLLQWLPLYSPSLDAPRRFLSSWQSHHRSLFLSFRLFTYIVSYIKNQGDWSLLGWPIQAADEAAMLSWLVSYSSQVLWHNFQCLPTRTV